MNDQLTELYEELEELRNKRDSIGDPQTASQVRQLADIQADINIIQEKITSAQSDL